MRPLLLVLLAAVVSHAAEPERAALTVSGSGEVRVPPDLALVDLGAVAEAQSAAAAQDQVNGIVERTLQALRAGGVAGAQVQTLGLSLTPVYRPRDQGVAGAEGTIVAHRATNVVRVRVEDLRRVGAVIDAGVAAGANQVRNLSFTVRDDSEPRLRALEEAARDARRKAGAIAEAMGVRLGPVREVQEGGVHVVQPRLEMRAQAAAAVATPVEPGQVAVSASVSVRYDLAGPADAPAGP
jgi:uncharacterized protein YggE